MRRKIWRRCGIVMLPPCPNIDPARNMRNASNHEPMRFAANWGADSFSKQEDGTMDSSDNDLRNRVIDERKRRRLTQTEFAAEAGVSARTIQYFEAGTHPLKKGTVASIARAAGITDVADAADAGDAVAEATRASWPADIEVILDMVGAYLDTLPQDKRLAFAHDLTRRIINGG